jgi:hypothetical protein
MVKRLLTETWHMLAPDQQIPSRSGMTNVAV